MRVDEAGPSGPRSAMDPTDAWWNGVEFTAGVLRADIPSAAAIADTLMQLAVDPRLGTWLDADDAAWRPVLPRELGTWIARSVVASEQEPADLDALMATQTEPLDDLPVRWVVGDDWLAVRFSHAFADGWTAFHYLDHVLRVARGEREVLPLPWTYLSAARRTALAAEAVAACPDPGTRARLRRRTAQSWEPADVHLAGRVPSVVHRTSDLRFGNRLRHLGRERFGLDGVSELLAAGLRSALGEALGTPRPGEGFVRDLREGVTAEAFGNHSVAIRVRPERETSPASIRDALDLATRSGLVHLTHLATRMRSWTHRSQRLVPSPIGRADLVLSVRDHRDAAARLPGLGEDSRLGVATVPAGPETLTVVAIESTDRWSLSTSFYDGFWSRQAVEAALDAFLADPVRLIERATA